GVILRAGEDRPFVEDDLVLAQGLADRAGIALAQLDAQRQAEEAAAVAKAARDEAEAASRAKDEFLAMLGHELRNPLSPIVTALELIAAKAGPDLARERAVLERQVRHLSRLVDDLLDTSR